MEMKKLDNRVRKMWYIRAAIVATLLLVIFVIVLSILLATNAPRGVTCGVLSSVGTVIALLAGYVLILPALRHKMYAWGYDEKRIVVKHGVIFRHRTVIPVCQIQDLHRTQGPLMMALKLSDVTISTAGSNFDISTLTTDEADRLIDTLEQHLETRVEELHHETI